MMETVVSICGEAFSPKLLHQKMRLFTSPVGSTLNEKELVQ